MKRIHLLPNAITAFSLSCGLFVIFKINMVDPGLITYSILLQTSALLLMAAFADLLDGAVARAMKAESEFGGLFDSMADAISFGVAPAIIVLKTASLPIGSFLSFFLTFGTMIFSICGVLRLVRYNVMSQTIKIDESTKAHVGQSFIGLPIPAAAAAIISLNLFFASPDQELFFTVTPENKTLIMTAVLVSIGYLMVSRWRFPSFKKLRIRVASFTVVFFTSIVIMLLLFGVLHHFAMVFLAISWAYLIISCLLSLIRWISGKNTKRLEDFQPIDEEDED